MVDIPNDKIVAPYIGTVESGQSAPSFAAYFLRDLHQQGRLNADIVKRVVDEHGTDASFEEIMGAITDLRGQNISEKLAQALETVARVGSAMN